MGFEYMFFDEALRDRFVSIVGDRGVACELRADAIEGFVVEGFVVEVPDGLPDDLMDAIDAEHANLMNEQMVQAESTEGWVTHQVAGVDVTLADGRSFVVRLPGPIARQLLENFTPDDVQALVTAIAESIEHPINGPLCKKA